MLDSALLRPGRFDRQVTVDRPDVAGRVQILKVHSRGKQIGKDVDFDKVSRRTPGAPHPPAAAGRLHVPDWPCTKGCLGLSRAHVVGATPPPHG